MKYILKKYYKYVLVLGIGILSFIGMYFYSYKNEEVITKKEEKKVAIKKVVDNGTEKKNTLFVDVKGAVNTPGVYEIEEGKRIIDAINLAGGLSSNANTINLNLSKKVTDEMYIIVYTKNEIYNYKKNNNSNITCASNECDCPDSNNDACISKESSKNSSVKVNGKVSINTGSKEQLMSLTGVGEAKANAIISYRENNGGFKSLEDIKNVSGIGDALYEKIKDNITL